MTVVVTGIDRLQFQYHRGGHAHSQPVSGPILWRVEIKDDDLLKIFSIHLYSKSPKQRSVCAVDVKWWGIWPAAFYGILFVKLDHDDIHDSPPNTDR